MQPQKLTNLQLELLKVFSYQLNQQQLTDIKNLLANYFAEQATQEMDKLWEENNWDSNTMAEWANEHLRAPYHPADLFMNNPKMNYFPEQDVIHLTITDEEEIESMELSPNITAELNSVRCVNQQTGLCGIWQDLRSGDEMSLANVPPNCAPAACH